MNKSSQKTVAIVAPYFPPYGGGLERYAYEIAKRLHTDHGWKVIVITSGEYRGKDIIEKTDAFTVYRLSYTFKFSNAPFAFDWFKKIRLIFKEENPDIVNIHIPVPGIGDVASLLAGKRPVVITYHTASMHKGKLFPDFFIWIYEHITLPILLHRAKNIACSSDFVRFDFLKRYINKSETITPAVDSNIFTPIQNKNLKRPTILFAAGFGRVYEHKGLRDLMDALFIIKKTIPEVYVMVAGDSDIIDEYKTYIKGLSLEDNVIFLGRLDESELVQAFHKSNIFCSPTSNESFGMTILEAMSCGLPVVATKVGGIPSLLDDGKTGFLVEPHNPKELAEKLILLLQDHKKAMVFGAAGYAKAIHGYRWNITTAKYNDIFNNLLQQSPSLVHIAAYYPPHLGGMERVAEEIAKQVAHDGYNITVLTSDIGAKNKPIKRISLNPNVRYLWSFEFAHTPFIPTLLWNLWRTKKPAIFHIHLAQAYAPEMVWLASKLRGIPYVLHFHLDVEPSGTFGFLYILWKRWIQTRVIKDAARVITLSPAQSQLIEERYHKLPSEVVFIGNGVSEAFLEIGKTKRTFHNPLRLLFVGRFTIQKRPDRLIEALKFTKSDVILDMVGEGEDRSKSEELVAKLGLKNITFHGRLDGEKLLDAYRNADVFVLPSDREGMPLVLLEAMATGLPIMGSDVLGITELIDGVGVVVKNPSPETFAKAIDNIASDPQKLTELSEASLKTADNYSWTKLIKRLEEVYKEISQ